MRRLRHIRVTALLGLPFVVALTLASAAQGAQTLTVCVKGGCPYTTIQAAVEAAKTGDTVVVRDDGLLGYTGQVVLSKEITLEGDPNGPRPTIKVAGSTGPALAIEEAGAGAIVKHLAVSAGETAIEINGSFATVTDVTATSGRFAILANLPAVGVTIGPGVSATGSGAEYPAVAVEGEDTLTGVTVTNTSGGGGAVLLGATISDSTITGGSLGTGLIIGTSLLATSYPVARRVLITGHPGFEGSTALLADSVVIGLESDAVQVDGYPEETLQLRNVTAVSSANGIEAPLNRGKIVGKNLIVRAAPRFKDLVDHQPGVIEVGYSNFATFSPDVDTTTLGHNQLDEDPQFVDGAIGPSEDFHLRDSSPAAGAGVKDAQTGTTDLDGLPRPAAGASEPTLGAYEVTAHDLAVMVSGSGSVSAPGLACPGSCANAYAVGSSVTLTATPVAGAVFEGWAGACSGVGSCQVTMSSEQSVTATFSVVAAPLGTIAGASEAGDRQKPAGGHEPSAPRPPSGARLVPSSFPAKKGTSLRMTLAETALIHVVVTQTQSGRKSAGRCTRSARRGARCTLTVQRAKLAFSGVIGSNGFKFLIPRLAPGRYRATIAAAVDGLSSTPVTLRFTVTKPKR